MPKLKRLTWWQILLLVITLVATIPKVMIGLDNDESYIVAMGIRMFEGDKWFAEMWELHMTSAWLAYLGVALFHKLTGSLQGVVIFLRIFSTIIQYLIAFFICKILKKYFRPEAAFLTGITIANFLPRATQNVEYGLLMMLLVTMAMTMLYDVLRKQEMLQSICYWELILAAMLYAIGVLAYPTIIFSFPVLLVGMLLLQKGEKRWRMPLVFSVICGLCAIVVFGIVLSYLPWTDFLTNLGWILNDGTHSNLIKTLTYGKQMIDLGKRAMVIFFVAVVFYLICRKWERSCEILWYTILLACALIIVGFNVTGLRPSGPIGLQIRYILAAILAVIFAYKTREKRIFWLFIVPGIMIYAGVMIGSNMGFEENASFLFLGVFAAILLMTECAGGKSGTYQKIGLFCIGCFVLSIIFCKGYLVRIIGTGPANITEERVKICDGTMAGIYAYPEYVEELQKKENEILKYTHEEDTMLYLGMNALCSHYGGCDYTTVTCISTPYYNDEWVAYFEDSSHKQPTIIFLDRDTIATSEEFLETDFGKYLKERYNITEENVIEEEMFVIFLINERGRIK